MRLWRRRVHPPAYRRGRAWLAWAFLAPFVIACAVARVSPDGTLYGFAIGEDARVERCEPRGEAGIVSSAPEACSRIVGAPLLPSILDGVGTVLTTAGKVLWGWMGL